MTRRGDGKNLNSAAARARFPGWWIPVLAVAAALALYAVRPRRLEAKPARWSSMPVFIVANKGQWPQQVRYAVRSDGLEIFFMDSGPVFVSGGRRLEIRFESATGPGNLEGVNALSGRVHFLRGSDPDNWVRDVPTYGEVMYREIYPGIDLRYAAGPKGLKAEFTVAPGADPRRIRWSYIGARGMRVEASGELVVDWPGGSLREAPPEIYQEREGRREFIKGRYRIAGDRVCFELGPWDPALPLVIDPMLSFSTYLGGSGFDSVRAVAADWTRNIYVAGYTDSRDLPVQNALQGQSGGGVDAFVAKLSPSGSLVYLTYLGGSGDDRAFGIAVDASGNAYLTGWTYSTNFPTTVGARQRVIGGGRDAFVSKLNAAGSGLVYSTFLGGTNHETGSGIAVDASGNALVAGETYSSDFPVRSAFQSSSRGRQEAFVAKLNPTGDSLLWSTYLGGYGDDRATAIAVDASGAAYVTGATDSPNFPTQSPIQGPAGGQDAFVVKLSPDGAALVYGTYLGGSSGSAAVPEAGLGIQVDGAGNAYVTGVTPSLNFPVVNALQAVYNGGTFDGFAAKLNAQGTALLYSTYLGGASLDYATAVSVNRAGVAAVAGYTASPNFPVLGGPQASLAGSYDAFLVRLSPQGNALEASTYLGGSGAEAAYGVFVDPAGNAWVAGQTGSVNFPLKNPAQGVNLGGLAGFVTKIGEITPAVVFRGSDNALWVTTYSAAVLRSAGGYFASEAAAAQHPGTSEVYAVIRNASGQLWLNIFDQSTQAWRGWVYIGEGAAGNPAVSVTSGGDAYIVSRTTASAAYRVKRYRPGVGVGGWMDLGGNFSSDPAAAAAPDGSLYVAGVDAGGTVMAGVYNPATGGFGGWSGSAGSSAGAPAMTTGSDGAAYVAVRTPQNTVSIARFTAAGWGSWFDGGGSLASDPDLAATAGTLYVVVRFSDTSVWVRPFTQGTSNGWQSWMPTGGYLSTAAIAAVGTRFHVAGFNASKDLWWFDSGAGWTHYGYRSVVGGRPAASPK
ncbi:MAG TPA: SBBP repeat-containing protein [Bryobacteraceae bacterium]|nr:SBBP repeat-containing protein [Bryobacteraceae bacterium]